VGKGYALQWLLDRLWSAQVPFDAAIVLDADSVVAPNFLRVMNARLHAGEQVVQAYYAALAPEQAWTVGMRAAALAAIHYLRPQGRMVIGGSAGLKGNGMLFHRTILQRYRWTASVTEDIEYHMTLILAGERVTFAPDAVVQAEMPDGLGAARSQNVRWEQGRLELARRYTPQLLRAAWQGRGGRGVASPVVLLDAVMEHLIPPFSLLVGLTLVLLLVAWAAGSTAGLLLALLLGMGEVTYLLAGLHLARAPQSVYAALLYAPLFLAWKCLLYLRVLLRVERQGWVRTTRISEKNS
jgi:cellulose synthase/poly-beta-1,6-N-acetylglucosamine synthase-like glycosyltransferase